MNTSRIMMVDKFMTMIRLLIVILNFSKLCHCDETCFHETSLETLAANYHFKSVCSSDHISDALRSDVQCGPVPIVVTLPWPNATDVQQMTPTHITVQRYFIHIYLL